MNILRLPLAFGLLIAACAWPVAAQTVVQDAWVRATVATQKVSAGYLQIRSQRGGALVAASSPQAGQVEIHEMRMDGDMMRMRAVDAVALPAGKLVEFKPGGYHLMLMDLKGALKAGDTLALALVVQAADGTRENVAVKALVKASGAAMEHKQ